MGGTTTMIGVGTHYKKAFKETVFSKFHAVGVLDLLRKRKLRKYLLAATPARLQHDLESEPLILKHQTPKFSLAIQNSTEIF